MSVALYDEALNEKIKYWVGGAKGLQFYTTDETRRLFEVVADNNNDKPIQLPLIAIARKPGYILNEKTKQPRTYAGVRTSASSNANITLMTIPITIEYQIDIYSRYLTECDEITRNLIFNIINYPSLTIEIPYENQKLTHNSNIRLQSDVEDNSNIPERLISGQFTRNTVSINIDDAFLFDVRVRNNYRLVEVDTATPKSLLDPPTEFHIENLLVKDN